MNRVWIGIGAVLVVALAIVLIVGRTRDRQEDIKVGVILELTGPLSPQGEKALNAIRLAVDEINSSGGINGKRLTIIVEDSRTDPKEGVAAFKKLTTVHKVRVIVGTISSSVVMSCAPLADASKTLLFSCGATSPLVTNAGDYVFRNRVSGELEVKKMAEFALNKLKIKSVGVIYVNNDFGRGNKDVFVREYQLLGGKVVSEESFDQGSTDYRTQITKIKKENPEAIYIIGHNIETAYIVLQARELGIRARFLSTLGVESPEVWRIARDAAEGIIYTVQTFDPDGNQVAAAFKKKYEEQYGSPPDIFAGLAYDAMQVIARSLREVGNDAERIKEYLYNNSFSGVMGDFSFDRNGDVVAPIIVKIAKNNTFVPYREGGE